MYVCVCNAVTDSDIRNAVDDGVCTMRQLRQKTGIASTCGCCKEMSVEILQQALADTREFRVELPVMQMA
jgi:bacterioferritin-associated ferredoxin